MLLPRSTLTLDLDSATGNTTEFKRSSLGSSTLNEHLKPRDVGIGIYIKSDIIIFLGVILGLAVLFVLIHLSVMRWGWRFRTVLSWLPCCVLYAPAEELSEGDLENRSPAAHGRRPRRVKKKPRIHDVRLVYGRSSTRRNKMSWKNIMPLSVRYIYPTNHRPLSHNSFPFLKDSQASTSDDPPSTSSTLNSPPLTPYSNPPPSPSLVQHACMRVAVAIAMPHDPSTCNTPCYELGVVDLPVPWKTEELRKKQMKKDLEVQDHLDRRMVEAMLLSSA